MAGSTTEKDSSTQTTSTQKIESRAATTESVRLSPETVAIIPPAIAAGIVAIQKEVAPLAKTAENPHFKNSYVPLSEVMREALKLLSQHDLGITQWPVSRDDKTFLITILMHSSGVSIQGEQELLLARRDSQGQGSSMTYARRYGIMSILGLVGDDDDDGNKAANQRTKPTAEQLSEIRQLCVDMKYPPDQVEARIKSLRTEDQATVVIGTLHDQVSQRAKSIKEEATATPVFTGSRDKRYPEVEIPVGHGDNQTVIDNLRKALLDLTVTTPLTTQQARKLVHDTTGKPFIENCTDEELTKLAETIEQIKAEHAADSDIAPPEDTA